MSATVNFLKDESVGNVIRVVCVSCQCETKHSVLASIDEKGTDGDVNFSFDWVITSQIVQCNGCDSISFRKCSSNSEDYDSYYTGNGGEFETIYHEQVDLYPNRSGFQSKIEEIHLIPVKTQSIYVEVQRALESSQPVLCGIGIRAIIESICNDLDCKGSLYEKIDDLVKKGVLTTEGAGILHKLRVLGNDAAHEVKPHKAEQLRLALTIVDHLLLGVYILPALAKKHYD